MSIAPRAPYCGLLATLVWLALLTRSASADDASAAGGHQLTLRTSGVHLVHGDAWVQLRPRVRIDGRWHAATGGSISGKRAVFHIGDHGDVVLRQLGPHEVQMSFVARTRVTVSGLELAGDGHLPDARAWLSNGKQSFSQSGVIALGKPASERRVRRALGARSSEEFRSGRELSWDYSYVGGGEVSLVAGSTGATTFRPWVQFGRRGNRGQLRARLVSGAADEEVALEAGRRVTGDPWHLSMGTDLPTMLTSYGRRVQSRRRHRPARAQIGWNSWYELFAHVDERAVRGNARELVRRFRTHVKDNADVAADSLVVYIDDGWEQQWGDWQANQKFPSGLPRLAADLKRQGISPGIWIAPLLARPESAVAKAHPDWFLPDTRFRHPSGTYRILDVTHPQAAEHLTSTIRGLVDAGFENLKVDFLFTGTFPGRRARAMTGTQAYNRAMRIIRRAAGKNAHILACGAPGLPSFPYVDAWRVGPDIAVEVPSRYLGLRKVDISNQLRNLSARWPFAEATLLDSEPLLQRGPARKAVVEQAARVAAAGGGGLMLSDDLRKVPRHRQRWGITPALVRNAVSGKATRPLRLFPEKPPRALGRVTLVHRVLDVDRLRVPRVWKTPQGRRVRLRPWRAPRRRHGAPARPRPPGRGK